MPFDYSLEHVFFTAFCTRRQLSKFLNPVFGQTPSGLTAPARFFTLPARMRHLFLSLVLVVFPIIPLGCASDFGHVQIVERPNAVETRRYQENFPEAYYDVDRLGNLRMVLRKHRSPSLEGDELTQTIVVESVWNSIPGVTVMHRTQINGTVLYALAGRRISQALTGAGSVHFSENDAKDRLTGTISNVTLVAQGPSEDDDFLQRVELSGDFSARRDPHQTLRLAHDVKRSLPTVASED
jgi:hypothetical protein